MFLTDTHDGMNGGWYERFPWYCHACLEVKRGPSRWRCNACEADLCLECGENDVRRTLGETKLDKSPDPVDGGRPFSPSKLLQSIADPSAVSVDFTATLLGNPIQIPKERLTSFRRVAVTIFDFLLIIIPVGIGIYDETFKSYTYAFDGCCPMPSGGKVGDVGNSVGGCLAAPLSLDYCLEQNGGNSVIVVTGLKRAVADVG